jgi:hypothetical protein
MAMQSWFRCWGKQGHALHAAKQGKQLDSSSSGPAERAEAPGLVIQGLA